LYKTINSKSPLLLVHYSSTHVYGLEKLVIRCDILIEHVRLRRMSDEEPRGFELHESRSLVFVLWWSK
jgi:hypothetical protein